MEEGDRLADLDKRLEQLKQLDARLAELERQVAEAIARLDKQLDRSWS